jgi:bifunctional DNase/RNase
VAFAASRSQSFFVISSAAAKRTIVDPAEHARSIQKNQQQISGRFRVARGSGERRLPACNRRQLADDVVFAKAAKHPQARSEPDRRSCALQKQSFPLSALKKYLRNFRQVRHGGEQLVFRPSISTVNTVNKTVIEVHVRAVLPTSGGCAVFIGNSDKVFIVYVDQTVGSAITMFMREMSKERPLTHDLMAHLMTAVGAHVERVIINDLKNATYYARMIIAAENELQQKKIIELDARPSDCIAMATQQKAPIYVSQEVWDEVEDMSDVLRKMEEEGLKPEIDPESEATEEE